MRKREVLRPKDYVRCAGCGRLVKKTEVKHSSGKPYGSECWKQLKIRSTSEYN